LPRCTFNEGLVPPAPPAPPALSCLAVEACTDFAGGKADKTVSCGEASKLYKLKVWDLLQSQEMYTFHMSLL
jgi:hypothetical protein